MNRHSNNNSNSVVNKSNTILSKDRIASYRKRRKIKKIIKSIVVYSVFVLLAINLYQLFSNKQFFNSIKSLSLSDYKVIIDDKTNDNNLASYSLGASVANDIAIIKKEQELTVGRLDNKYIISGFIDALNGNSQLSSSEIDKQLSQIDEKISEDLNNKFEEIAKKNIENEKKFLSENRNNKGVKETLSGLQYKIIKSNPNGKALTKDCRSAIIAYKGKNLKGDIFDQNEKYNVNIADTLPGLNEALLLMKEGEEFEVYIPSSLAYKHHAVGSLIEPYSALIFNIKLIKVEK